MHEPIDSQYDLTILGGGLAGLTLALQAKKKLPTLKIAVFEKQQHPVPEAAHKVGESSVEVAAHYFCNILGLKDHLLCEQLPKLGLRFFFPREGNAAIERRLELGGTRFPPSPSFQLDRGRFENFLAEECERKGITVCSGARIREVLFGKGSEPHTVRLSHDRRDMTVQTRWVVDASGRAAILKRKLNLAKESAHRASAAWFRVGTQISVDDWSSDPEWKAGHEGALSRWFSTNHLLGEGYWVWLIPLASGSTSVGIVADERIHPLDTFNSLEKAMAWLRRYEPQCAEKISPHLDQVQDFLAMKRYAHDCKQLFSHRRWALTGEAGVFLDPFYSPGSDFIAFSNTFICELLARDFVGKSNLFYAPLYDKIYKTFYHGTAVVYQDKYPLFGNHQVMPVKVLWDYVIYWTLTGFLFFHNRTTSSAAYLRNLRKVKRINDLNRYLQQFFIRWHSAAPAREVEGKINMSNIPLIFTLNSELQEQLEGGKFHARFTENARRVEALFWQILDHASLDESPPFRRPGWAVPTTEGYFAEVFKVTNASTPDASEPALRAAAGGGSVLR